MEPFSLMREAIGVARDGIAAGQTPFGAIIVQGNHIVARTHNTVWQDVDPTAHAEVNAIREACQNLKSISLERCVMYSTCEPCPMCLSAIHWAKLRKVNYGATIADALAAGFSELEIEAHTMIQLGGSPLEVESGILEEECRALFDEWKQLKQSLAY